MATTMATPVIADAAAPFFPYPYSISPLPDDLQRGLIAPGTTGVLSAVSCIAMLLFVMYRFLTWRTHYKSFVGYNQYVVLISNLLLADMMQGISFMFSFHWIHLNGIFAPTKTCFGQGYLLNLGDLASGFFVLGIALHTFYGAVLGTHVKHTVFIIYVISAWVLALFLSSIGPMLHRNKFFVRAGAWCWISPEYETERLAFHYFWIFLVQFGTIILYALIFIHLKRTLVRILPSAQSTTHARVDRAAKLMVLFPISYIVLTLPLSAGRMWSMANGGKRLSDNYLLTAGSMIGSCGIIDCLLYTLTRRSLLRQTSQGTVENHVESQKQEETWRMVDLDCKGAGITQTRTVTITGDRLSTIHGDISSTESLNPLPIATLERTYYLAPNGYIANPQERKATAGLESLDPRKGGQKVEITATAVEVEHSAEANLRGSQDTVRTTRVESPYNVRHALALFKGPSTR